VNFNLHLIQSTTFVTSDFFSDFEFYNITVMKNSHMEEYFVVAPTSYELTSWNK